jgi:hypothetical protein
MTKLSNDELRVLRLLARSENGCTEPAIVAQGFTLDQIADLIFRGLAKREVRNMPVDGRQVKIVRMQITPAGLQAIAD